MKQNSALSILSMIKYPKTHVLKETNLRDALKGIHVPKGHLHRFDARGRERKSSFHCTWPLT
jgi:hypothetical protein